MAFSLSAFGAWVTRDFGERGGRRVIGRHPAVCATGFSACLFCFSFSEAIVHTEFTARAPEVTHPQDGVLECTRQARKRRGSREG